MAQTTISLDAADAYCRQLVKHYENFTVASRLSPRSLRRDLTRVYAFCRFTDDLGDESGDRAVAMRRLRRWRDETRESFDHAATARTPLRRWAGSCSASSTFAIQPP